MEKVVSMGDSSSTSLTILGKLQHDRNFREVVHMRLYNNRDQKQGTSRATKVHVSQENE